MKGLYQVTKIKDIAKKTGFSITTVSRVLNQDPAFNVPHETRLTIITAAEELNYIPLSKRQKTSVKKSSLTIGLIYWYSLTDELVDPYYLSIRLAIENGCEVKKINLKRFQIPKEGICELDPLNVDGIIALGKYSEREVNQLFELSPALVLVDCYHKHYEIDVVMTNLQEATQEIIEYFKAADLTAVGFIGGVEKTLDGQALEDPRLTTYQQYEWDQPNAIYLGSFNADSGYHIMQGIIKSGQLQQAYIVASDAIAIGCLKALSEHQIRVPEDVSLVSYDNISLSQYTIPALTTLDMNTLIMGQTAVELLVDRISTQRQIGKKVFIPTRLIKRGSSI